MDFLVQSESAIRVTAVRLRIRIYNSNDLYEAANPCTFLVGSPVLEIKYPYCVQIFSKRVEQGASKLAPFARPFLKFCLMEIILAVEYLYEALPFPILDRIPYYPKLYI